MQTDYDTWVWQIHAEQRFMHCAQVMGAYPEYNQLWDLVDCGVANIYTI